MDKVTTLSAGKGKKTDTSAPLEVGMAAGINDEEALEEIHGRASELAVQAVYKGKGATGGWNGGKASNWSAQRYFNGGKGEKGANRAGKGRWSKTGGKKGGKGQEKGDNGNNRGCWNCGKAGNVAANCIKGSWKRSLYAADKDKEDESYAWCLLDESESEQWQEVVSNKSIVNLKKIANGSLLSVENSCCAPPQKVVEVRDNWANIRATMGTGVVGHVPTTGIELHKYSKEILRSKWRKDQRLGREDHTIQIR